MKFACCKSTTDGVSESVTCSKCDNSYHVQCLYPSEKRKKDLPKHTWVCPQCAVSKPRQLNNDSTPVRGNLNENVTIRRGGSALTPHSSDSYLSEVHDTPSILELIRSTVSAEISSLKMEFKSLITPVQNDLKSIKDDFMHMKDSLEFFNAKFEEFGKRIDSCEMEVNVLTSRYSEIGNLRTCLDSLQLDYDNREQWARRSNVEIYGIPEKKGENLISILKTIADKSDFKLDVNYDIDFITRVATKSTENKRVKPIIVRFLQRWKKDEFLTQARKLKLKCSDINLNSHNNRIYFNDHLTSKNKQLLQSVKKIAKEKNYDFVWVKNCCIMIRRNSSSPVLHILNNNDLKKIV